MEKEKHSLIVAPFIEKADLAAREYVSNNEEEKTYEGLKKHISNVLTDSPLSPDQKRDITDIIAEEYKEKLKAF
jgi:hypothetical protein